MARYLLIAHQTADRPELARAALKLSSGDPDATFDLVIPATPVVQGWVWDEGETKRAAGDRGREAAARLRELGVDVVSTRVGDADPVYAIGDELTSGAHYDAVVISTLPAGVSRWLKMDVLSRLRRQFPSLHVIHVVADMTAVGNAEAPVRPIPGAERNHLGGHS